MDSREQFFVLLNEAVSGGSLVRLTLSKNRGDDPTLKTLTVRPVEIKGGAQLSFVYRYQTRDVTKNHLPDEALNLIRRQLGPVFKNAHLQTADEEAQLLFSKKGRASFSASKKSAAQPTIPTEHDREKRRMIDPARPFLKELGVTNAAGRVLPSMTRKWKQINAFLEIINRALEDSPLAESKTLHIADFGAGKGYLTFAVHDFFNANGIETHMTGIELRDDLVRFCNGAAEKLNLETLRFRQGDVRSYAPERLNILIALHACDVATDIAIHTGIRTGADIVLCAPCCHKEIRPQIQVPEVLAPLLGFGVHLGQEADMITDTMRALLLETAGYSAKVFEFISPEHTGKNKMILAVKRRSPSPQKEQTARAQYDALKAWYGIRTQYLETLLAVE
jgi:hypothetical protein